MTFLTSSPGSTAAPLDVGSQITEVWPLEAIHDAIAAVRAGHVVRAVIDYRA